MTIFVSHYIVIYSIVCWHEHLQRITAGACWAHKLFSFRDPQALADLRTPKYGRPDVRAASGFTSIRWYEAVHKALEWQTVHEQLQSVSC